jgi:hypothetical protein
MAEPDDDLYGLPLEEFTPARDAAARELRRAGDRETAARVAKLPKPSPAAWTANQVAREQPELIEALLEAGATLREAQDAAVSGGGGTSLREATLAQRSTVDAVVAAAMSYRPAGKPLSRAMADRLRTTLNAAAGDEAISDALAHGRLVSEAQAGGAWPFALAGGDEAPPKPRPRAKKAPKPDPAAADAAARAAEERKALEAQLREARGSLRVRDRAATAAQRDADTAAKALARATGQLEAARRELDDAQADAEAAERVRDEARAALQEARDEVARLEERLD